MSLRRTDSVHDNSESNVPDGKLAAETLRAAAAEPAKPGEDKVSNFVKIFGGTLLSICALAVLTSYQQLASGINELRAEMGRINEAKANFSKKDELENRIAAVNARLNELQALNLNLTSLTERVKTVEATRVSSELAHKEAVSGLQAAMTHLKDRASELAERLRAAEQDHRIVKELQTTLTVLRENLARDSQQFASALETQKVTAAERALMRDQQMKELETERRQLAREVSQLRERLSRAEAQLEKCITPPAPPRTNTAKTTTATPATKPDPATPVSDD